MNKSHGTLRATTNFLQWRREGLISGEIYFRKNRRWGRFESKALFQCPNKITEVLCLFQTVEMNPRWDKVEQCNQGILNLFVSIVFLALFACGVWSRDQRTLFIGESSLISGDNNRRCPSFKTHKAFAATEKTR